MKGPFELGLDEYELDFEQSINILSVSQESF